MTMLLLAGLLRRFRIDDQLKVPIDTMIITATNAAIGIRETQSSRNTTINSSSTPATRQDSRPRPPDCTLITDWPIMAQPAIPPIKPAAILPIPCALHSRPLSLSVSVRSSTMVAVIIDSSRPTTASDIDTGKIMLKVSKFSGTSGHKNIGRASGSSPISPTVRTSIPKYIATAVQAIMHTNGDGTALVTSGSRNHARPAAGKRRDDGNTKGGIQPDLRIHASDNRKGNGLWDQCQSDHHAR